MIKGINSSKKQYFIWLSVFLVLFLGLMIFMLVGESQEKDFFTNSTERIIGVYVLPYVLATLPMGWAIRRKFMRWYAHIPTEKIKIFEPNLILAAFRLGAVQFFLCLDLALFVIYFVTSILIGIFFTPYFIISGIVLMITKKI